MKNLVEVFGLGLILYVLGFILFPPVQLLAQGDLMVFPKRLVFEVNKKSQELNIANTGKDTAKYSISFVQRRMKPDGGFEQISQPDSGQYFADKFLRIFPRNIILAPGESQVIKVQLTKTSEMENKEYRSHIYFRSESRNTALGEADTTVDTTSISIKLKPVYGITIPVIIRSGDLTAQTTLTDLSVEFAEDTIPILNITFNRFGNKSIYGHLTIDYISNSGAITKVSEIKGISVYTPNLKRSSRIELSRNLGINYKSGKLKATFVSANDDKTEVLANAELELR